MHEGHGEGNWDSVGKPTTPSVPALDAIEHQHGAQALRALVDALPGRFPRSVRRLGEVEKGSFRLPPDKHIDPSEHPAVRVTTEDGIERAPAYTNVHTLKAHDGIVIGFDEANRGETWTGFYISPEDEVFHLGGVTGLRLETVGLAEEQLTGLDDDALADRYHYAVSLIAAAADRLVSTPLMPDTAAMLADLEPHPHNEETS